MILYDVTCERDHVFEAWFRNAEAFETQSADGRVSCPVCGDRRVRKAPMAPAIGGRAARGAEESRTAAAVAKRLRAVREHVESHFEHVGPRFAEEARKIHNGEAEARGIYGSATEAEARGLHDDGVPFAPLPGRRDS